MFGAKIQKWMEIVRPRKKSNKNKNGNSNSISQNASNDYKGAVCQNESSISSPARRSEVSPIQSHNGRRGWQSPNQEVPIAARLDYNLNKPTGKHNKAGTSISTNSTHNSSSNKLTNYLTTAPTNFYQMKEIDQSMMQTNPKIIVTCKSTTSINNNSIHYNNTLHPPSLSYSTANSSSNELLDEKTKYLVSSSSSSVNSAVVKNQNESNNNRLLDSSNEVREHPSENKYGKIQPINKCMSKYRFFSKNTSRIDNNNRKSSEDFKMSNVNMHDASTAMSRIAGKGGSNNNNLIRSHDGINTAESSITGQCFPLQSVNTATTSLYENGNRECGEKSSSYLTPSNTLTPSSFQSNSVHKLGYSVINHVSSPESAYSTGYSTDGNSPGGASYSPEYYINIRTGIHYFPKGNASIDPGSNRFKSGLNCIEEKQDEQKQLVQKAGESFGFCKKGATSSPQRQLTVIDQLRAKSIPTPSNKGNCIVIPNPGMSPVLRKNIIIASQFRTPSPRQRCRIRTNPWFSSVDPEPFHTTSDFKLNNKRRDRDSGGSTTSSSGIRSNSDHSREKFKAGRNLSHLSDSDPDSSNENPSKTLVSRANFSRKHKKENSHKNSNSIDQHGESDDDATLNEIGKFDESYVYEKENDIISDSDQTDCVSDLGQEAGDECDTDDLLDVGHVDKSKRKYMEESHRNVEMSKKKSESNAFEMSQEHLLKKKKKNLRKRNKHSESNTLRTPIISNRVCRSVGGTPVSIRKNENTIERRQHDSSLLSNRSNSLTFSEVHLIHSRMLAISESEKALIKADLEADVKYRQLINEAESILVSMKFKEILQPSPVISSPRRVCNVPTNKRVFELKQKIENGVNRSCEIDAKLTKVPNSGKFSDAPPSNASSTAIIHKRIEMLRYETSISAPSSPKSNRVAPIKTHVTNFIYQNDIETTQRHECKGSPKPSAPLRRRFFTPKQDADTDSESDNKSTVSSILEKENGIKKQSRRSEQPKTKLQTVSFRSIVCNNAEAEDLFFPQSEPLKRKIYSCNSTIDKIQKSLDFDSELPRKALLMKIQMLRKERQAKSKEEAATELIISSNPIIGENRLVDAQHIKRKLIMKTIESLKRSLEDQSSELNELNDSDG